MKNKKTFCLVATLAMLGAGSANALPITVNVVGADWTNAVGESFAFPSTLQFIDTDGVAGNEEIRWGSPQLGIKSGYRFDGAAPPAFTVETGDVFSFGSLTHFNFPIGLGTALTSAQLNLTAELLIGGNTLSEGPFTFSFLHNETPNSCAPAPDCANDIVTFSNLASSDTFVVDGIEYTLTMLGFDSGGGILDHFSTQERQASTAALYGSFSAVVPTPVPEPHSLGLIGLGLLAMAFGRRSARRRQA